MARRVLFLRNFDMRVSTSKGLAIIAYRKGMELLIPEAHAQAALAAQAALDVHEPSLDGETNARG